MSRRRRGLVALLALALLGLLLSTPAAAKPRHHHKCKRSQATVKINGKRRCKPVKSVFPKPRAGDERIAAWKTILSPAPGIRDRRGRKLLSLRRSHGSAGRKLYTALAATMREGFARLDALDEAAPRPQAARAGASGSGCGGSPIPRKETFVSGKVAGITVSGEEYSSQSGKSLVFRAKSGDKFVRTSVEDFNCHNPPPPSCPTAAGALDSKGSGRERVTFLYFEDGELVASTISTTETTTNTKGRTAADARLDHIDIDYTVHATLQSGPASAMTTQSSTEKRHVRVNMRARPESYAPGTASLSSTGAKLAEIDEKTFAALVGNRIETYRSLEVGGGFADTPGKCAELKFSPASDTLLLKLSQKGTVNARVESNGKSENPRATAEKSAIDLTGKANANVTPGSGKGKVVPFSYTVTRAGGVKVTAGFRATSTAGLAAPATWTQPTKGKEPPVKRITGTFSGSWDYNGAHFGWTGAVTLTRPNPADPGAQGHYVQSGGTVTYTASGLDPIYQACSVSQTEQFSLPSNPGRGIALVNGTPPEFGAPYSYAFNVVTSNTDFMRLTLSGCSSGNESLNGTTEDAYFGSPMDPIETGSLPDQTSPDGIIYDGQETLRYSHWSWTLRGETS